VVHGDGIDEFSVCGSNTVAELGPDGSVSAYTMEPEDVGLPRYELDELSGGTPEENAALVQGILRGNVHHAKRDVVLFNAGAAFYLAEKVPSIAEGVQLAARLIDEGWAARKLDEYLAFGAAA
ncbi:MAG TPA: anthranilate phosphoribosyltransferase, partial [Trueperaceae bacterium]